MIVGMLKSIDGMSKDALCHFVIVILSVIVLLSVGTVKG